MPRFARHLRLTAVLLTLVTAGLSGYQARPSSSTISPDVAVLLLTLDRLQALRWYPSTTRLMPELAPERALVRQSLGSPSATLRRVAVRGVGRFENPNDVPTLAPFLADPDLGVRREAAYAIAQCVSHSKDGDVIPAYDALKLEPPPPRGLDGQLLRGREYDAPIAAAEAARVEAMARLRYSHLTGQKVFETFWDPLKLAPILIMLRQDGALEIPTAGNRNDRIRDLADRIRQLTNFTRDGDPAALEVLIRTGHAAPELLTWASLYHCPKDMAPFPCSAMREIAVQNLSVTDPLLAPALDTALHDTWPNVRVIALRRVALAIPITRQCEAMIDVLKDDRELVMLKIEAIALLDARCVERDDVIAQLKAYAKVPAGINANWRGWPIRAQAVETLAKIDGGEAMKAIAAATSDIWPVRAAAARAALKLQAADTLRKLAEDDHPNVRTEALIGLTTLADPATTDLALKNLGSRDLQLVLVAADALRDSRVDRQQALVELWATFKRLTAQARDASRFPRLAILRCMEQWAPPVDGASPLYFYLDDLKTTLTDVDPDVAEAASVVIWRLTGAKPVPTPTYRAPQQPEITELTSLPAGAIISLDTGDTLELRFLKSEAPLTIARIAKLANAAFYNNLPLFYRYAPFIAANGWSPDGNDLSGDARFVRDEIGAEPQTAGAVGLLSHGRDTADGRIFVNLTNQPGFEGEYAIFARVVDVQLNDVWGYGRSPLPPWSALITGGNITSFRLLQ